MFTVQWNTKTAVIIYMILMSFLITSNKASNCVIDCRNSTLETANCTCDNRRNTPAYCSALQFPNNKTTEIPIKSLSTLSIHDEHHTARDALLGNTSSAWCAGNFSQQYLQIDFGNLYQVHALVTQGLQSANISGHVTEYTIQFSLDNHIWYGYQETNQSIDKIFSGNNDTVHISCNSLKSSTGLLVARFLRIHPVSWVNQICMRLAILGVPSDCTMSDKPCRIIPPCTSNHSSCLCPLGFFRNGRYCEDINECLHNATCSPNTVCVNTFGSFNCNCKHGYHRIHDECVDIDECITGNHPCSSLARCKNIIGSFSCHCLSGYHGDGKTCWDINECELDLHSCHSNTTCINTLGSYRCVCEDGYEDDAYNCTGSTVTGKSSDVNLGLVIGLPVLAVVVIVGVTGVLLVFRRRKIRVIRRPKTSSKTNSRPSSTVFGQIDKLFDDERKTRDSVSLHSLQFSIPSLHPSLTALNNIGVNTKAAPYETL